jgi:uncharacterized membrane protein HdeD (DUF308 family)
MTPRRTTLLAGGGGVLLSVIGVVCLWHGASHGPTWLTVSGIVLTLAGLVCLRVVFWARRVRAMTRAGLALAQPEAPPEDPGGGAQDGASS